jgi:hypothetical protein
MSTKIPAVLEIKSDDYLAKAIASELNNEDRDLEEVLNDKRREDQDNTTCLSETSK